MKKTNIENNDSSSSSPLVTKLGIVAGILAVVALLVGAGFYRKNHKKDVRDKATIDNNTLVSKFYSNFTYVTPSNASMVQNENYYLQPQTQQIQSTYIENPDTYSEIIYNDSNMYNLASSEINTQYYDNIVSQNENSQELYDLAGNNENSQELYDLASSNKNIYDLTSSK